MARIKIFVPTPKGNIEAEGNVALIKFGVKGTRVRCILQDKLDGRSCEVQLVHAASGQIIRTAANLNAIKVRYLAGAGKKLNTREAAQKSVNNLCGRFSVKKVLSTIMEAEVLNPGK